MSPSAGDQFCSSRPRFTRGPSLSAAFVFQLTVGLYEFEVTVDGEGAHGKGYVNVTVNPGACKQQPPVTLFWILDFVCCAINFSYMCKKK